MSNNTATTANPPPQEELPLIGFRVTQEQRQHLLAVAKRMCEIQFPAAPGKFIKFLNQPKLGELCKTAVYQYILYFENAEQDLIRRIKEFEAQQAQQAGGNGLIADGEDIEPIPDSPDSQIQPQPHPGPNNKAAVGKAQK